MSLEKIIAMVPPPAHPVHTGDPSAWASVQVNMGVVLPDDLCEFTRLYGSGYFEAGHSVQIYNPFDPKYASIIKDECECYLSLKEDSPQFCPYDCFPEKDGLFAVACCDTGLQFYIIPSDDPKRHRFVFNDRSTGYLEYPVPMFEFFYDFLNSKMTPYPNFTGKFKFVVPKRKAPG